MAEMLHHLDSFKMLQYEEGETQERWVFAILSTPFLSSWGTLELFQNANVLRGVVRPLRGVRRTGELQRVVEASIGVV